MVARLNNGRVGVVARSTAGWFAWQDLGFACRDKPAVAIHSGRFIVAARGTDDGLWIGGFQHWTASGASLNPSPGSQRLSGAPAAVAPGPNGIHVIARREGDSHLIHAVWNYQTW